MDAATRPAHTQSRSAARSRALDGQHVPLDSIRNQLAGAKSIHSRAGTEKYRPRKELSTTGRVEYEGGQHRHCKLADQGEPERDRGEPNKSAERL